MLSVNFTRLRHHLDILHEEYREADYILDLLKSMQTQDEMTGGMNRRLISDQISVINKQKEYIHNRKRFLETSIERFYQTKQMVSDNLDDAIQELLRNV